MTTLRFRRTPLRLHEGATFLRSKHQNGSSDRQNVTSPARGARQRDERGFFTIWVLGLCVMVLLCGGLSLDLWRGFSDRRQLSAIVDAAAVAAASQVDLVQFQADGTIELDQAAAISAAQTYLTQAQAETGMELTDPEITFDDGNIVVTATTVSELTITKVLVPEGTLPITVSGVAQPRGA